MRVTAGQLRARGIQVPAEVPDCASGELAACEVLDGHFEGDVLHLTFGVEFKTPFTWIDIQFTLGEGEKR